MRYLYAAFSRLSVSYCGPCSTALHRLPGCNGSDLSTTIYNSIDTTKWHGMYATTGYCPTEPFWGCTETYQGLAVSGGILSVTACPNYSDFTDKERVDLRRTPTLISTSDMDILSPTIKIASRHFGRGRRSHGVGGIRFLPLRTVRLFLIPDVASMTAYTTLCTKELDLVERVEGPANRNYIWWTIHDQCDNGEWSKTIPAVSIGDLSTQFVRYAVGWKKDGTPHGTICGFVNEVPQGCYTLKAISKSLGRRDILANQMIPCPSGKCGMGWRSTVSCGDLE